MITARHFKIFHLEDGIRDVDTLAVDETELEQMREFSTREFLNLTPATSGKKKKSKEQQQNDEESDHNDDIGENDFKKNI